MAVSFPGSPTAIPGIFMRRRLSASLALLVLTSTLQAQDRPHVYRASRIIPIAGAPIDNGVLVVQNGRITAVGPRASVSEPANAIVHDLTGKVLMPGLVDTHSHIGSGDGG